MSDSPKSVFSVAFENGHSLGKRLWCELEQYDVAATEQDADIVKIFCEDRVEKLAHRLALKVSSEHLEKLLVETNCAVIELEVSSPVLDIILHFIYGKACDIDASLIIPLFSAAKRLKIRGLPEIISSSLQSDHYEQMIDEPEIIEGVNDSDMLFCGELFTGAGLTLKYWRKLVERLLRWKDLGENRNDLALKLIDRCFDPQLQGPQQGPALPFRPTEDPSTPSDLLQLDEDPNLQCFYVTKPTRARPFHEIFKLSYTDDIRIGSYQKFRHPSPNIENIGCVLKGNLFFELSPESLSVLELLGVDETTGLTCAREIYRTANNTFKGIFASRDGVHIWTSTKIFHIDIVNDDISSTCVHQSDSSIANVFGLFPTRLDRPTLAVILKSDPRKITFYKGGGQRYSSISIAEDEPIDRILTVSDSDIVGIDKMTVTRISHIFVVVGQSDSFKAGGDASRAVGRGKLLWVSGPGFIQSFDGREVLTMQHGGLAELFDGI